MGVALGMCFGISIGTAFGSMYGNTTSSSYIANNLITGNRVAALGESYSHVVKAFDHNGALALVNLRLFAAGGSLFRFGPLCQLSQKFFLGDLAFLLFAVFFVEPVHHLALFQAAMTNGRQN